MHQVLFVNAVFLALTFLSEPLLCHWSDLVAMNKGAGFSEIILMLIRTSLKTVFFMMKQKRKKKEKESYSSLAPKDCCVLIKNIFLCIFARSTPLQTVFASKLDKIWYLMELKVLFIINTSTV